jgi:hypothetical protein
MRARTRRDIAYGLVVVWALAGTAACQVGNPEVVTTAEVGAVGVGVSAAIVALATEFA